MPGIGWRNIITNAKRNTRGMLKERFKCNAARRQRERERRTMNVGRIVKEEASKLGSLRTSLRVVGGEAGD